MFPRFKPFRSLLLPALLLLAGAGSAAAQTALSPQKAGATLNTLAFSWSAGGGGPYIVALSTASNFSVRIATGSTAALTTTYINLDQNTTYYFRVKKASENDTAYALNGVSSTTMAGTPAMAYSIPAFFTAASSYTAVAKIGWDTANNPAWTRYELEYADNSGFASSILSIKGYPPVDAGGLLANTTYYFRVRARSLSGIATNYTPPLGLSTATLAMKITGISESVVESSAAISWAAVNGPTQAEQAEGYRLHVATTASDLISPTSTYWETAVPASAAVDLSPLDFNTTYYYRIGTLNWNFASNLSETRSFTTLASKITSLSLQSVTEGAAGLAWTALTPGDALAYRLEASTGAFTGAQAALSSTTYDMADNSLTVAGLDANTTYYFRTSSINLAYTANYTAAITSITLASPPSANLATIIPEPEVITVFIYPLPAAPQRSTCEGYRLEASTAAFGAGGVVLSSVTADPQAGALAIGGLKQNTDYHMRLATLNWDGTPNYSALTLTRTALPPAPAGPAMGQVWQSSATIYFSAVAGGDSYMVEASTYQFFDVVSRSSATTSVALTTLTISGLDENTKYYFRAGGLYGGTTVYANTSPAYMSTLPLPLMPDSPPFPGVHYSSITMSWATLADSPQKLTAAAYVLEAATTSAFTTVLFSSQSALSTASRLTLQGLSPNTTYYLRAGSLNSAGNANYSVVPATATLANPPTPQATYITPFTMNLTWLPNSNPPDTVYLVTISSNSDFSAPVHSSATALSSATFSALVPNTTYYPVVTAYNRFNRPAPTVVFSSMATGAFHPAFDNFSDVGVSSMTANWLPGTNPANTWYRAQISSNTDFSATVLSSITLNLYAGFTGMVSNASYYMRVSALNLTGVPTDPPVDLGAALTLPATAYVLPPAQGFSGALTDGFTVNWADNNNSSHTWYNVLLSTMSDFSTMNSSLTVRALSASFRDLQIDTTYFARLQARGQTGVLSVYVDAGSTRTLLSSQLNAVSGQDNTISLQTSYGLISVRMPRGSIGSSTRLLLQPVSSFAAPLSAVSVLSPTGIGLSVTHFPPTLVLDAITITLPYRRSDLPSGTDRSKLILALYDEVHSVWVPLPSVSDMANDRVIGQTWHLSTFQIMQATSEAGLSNVKIYPNPYRPNSVSDVMHFTNMTPGAKVKIYTFLGELVRDLKADGNGMAHWDGLNSDGRKAASGVYIAFIQTADKKNGKSFKVAVER
ncbi:MAG: fibronectin type III domain-containing protein [Elusimicrobia bacterium]|nr:fibronectin type III domain-containing protein [Elusimicrobiota bacterium]